MISPRPKWFPKPVKVAVSPGQLAVWFGQQLVGPAYPFHHSHGLVVRGPLEEDRLRAAMAALTARHDALRIRIATSAGMPHLLVDQIVAPTADVALAAAEGITAHDLRAWAAAGAAQPFDLVAGPAVRLRAYRTSAREHLLALTCHAMLVDSRSVRNLVTELLGELDDAGPVTGDTAAWWQHRPTVPELASLEHWLARVAGVADRLAWPGRTTEVGSVAEVRRPLDASLLEGVARLAAGAGAGIADVLRTAFRVVVGRQTGQYDVLIAEAPAAGHPGEPAMVGPLDNLVVRRNALDPGVSFRAALESEAAGRRGDEAHRGFPFPLLATTLNPRASAASGLAVHLMFEHYTNAPLPAGRHGLAPVSPVHLDRPPIRCELALSVIDGPCPQAVWSYAQGPLDASTVADLATRFEMVLRDAVPEPDQRLFRLTSQPSQDQSSAAGPATARPEGSTDLLAQVQRWVERTPEAVAVQFEDDSLSYAGLAAWRDRVADLVAATCPAPETRVAVLLHRGTSLPAVLLGVLAAGCAVVALDPAHPKERLAYLLRDSGAALLLAGPEPDLDEMAAWLVSDRGDGLRLARLPQRPAAWTRSSPSPMLAPGRAAAVVYTSGSTGRPKGIVVPHRGLVNCLDQTRALLDVRPGQTLLAVTTISFDIAMLELLLPLVSGARTVVAATAEARDGERLRALLERVAPDIMQATPMTWQMLFLSGWPGSEQLIAHVGGDVVTPALAARLSACTAAMWHTYGPTEASMYTVCEQVQPGPQPDPLPIGRPIGLTGAQIRDERLRPTPPGVIGELCLHGVGLARGYLGLPGLTAARFVADPDGRDGERLYRTGDRARLRPDGRIELHGRIDRQVKIRGHRVEPGEVEAVLNRHPDVDLAAVVIAGETSETYRLVACLQPAPAAAGDVAARVSAYARSVLPAALAPSSYVLVDSLPRTPNGKVDRAALSATPAAPATGRKRRRTAPVSAEQAWVSATWEAVLSQPMAQGRDSFSSGGDLVRAAQVLALARDEWGVDIPLADFVRDPTVPGMAQELLRARLAAGPRPAATRLMSWLPGGGRDAPLLLWPAPDRATGYAGLAAALPGRTVCTVEPVEPGRPADAVVSDLLAVCRAPDLVLVGHGAGASAALAAGMAVHAATATAPPVIAVATLPGLSEQAVRRYPGQLHAVVPARADWVAAWQRQGRRVAVTQLPGTSADLLETEQDCARVAGVLTSVR